MLSGKPARVKIAKRQINAVKYFVICFALTFSLLFTKLKRHPFAERQLLLAVGSCWPLLINKWVSPEWVCILPKADFWLIFFLLPAPLDHWKKIWLEWRYFPLNQILLVVWKPSKWENKPSYSAWGRCSQHKINIAAGEAVACSLSSRMVNPSSVHPGS